MTTLNLVHKAYIGDINIYVYAVGINKFVPERCVIEVGHYRKVPYQVAVKPTLEAAKQWIADQLGEGKQGNW